MVSAWGITDKGVARRQNQDAYYVHVTAEGSAWGVVCDGMGGAKAGDIASSIAVEVFSNHMAACDSESASGEYIEVLQKAVEEANQAVYHKAVTDRDCTGMGTTLVGLIIHGSKISVVNVGDSRAYLISKDHIKKITRDHSVVETLVEKGNITPEQARQHPQKNLITRALGTGRSVKADLFEVEASGDEYLLLCSDGLVNELTDQEIQREVIRGGTAKAGCDNLLKEALSRGASDNVTVVLFRM